ncbi:MAG: hypothetical protein KAT75_06235, partial [Dehalococcoidia bacterium]|nr:hypothetical protein [Dehalococcoidia bacterium]
LAYARYCQARSFAWAGLSGLFCGLAAGCKLTGGAFLLIVGFLIILNALRAPRLNWCSLLICLTLFGGLGLLMVGPWYARSYAFTGNPVWPFLYQVFGGEDWDWLGHEYNTQCLQKMWVVDLPLSPKGVWLSLRYLFFEPFRLGGYSGGLGQVLLGLASLSVLTLRRAPRLVYNLFLMVVLYYAMWFLFVSHQVRYLFPILPPLTLLGAFAFYALWDRLRLPALRWIMAGALLFFLGRDSPWIQPGQRNLTMNCPPYVTSCLFREVFLDEQIDVMPALRYMNTSFILDSPGWLYTELRYWEHDCALLLALESQCGVQVARWQDIVLYQLVECRD